MGVSALRVFHYSDSFRQRLTLSGWGYRELLATIIDHAREKALKTEEAV